MADDISASIIPLHQTQPTPKRPRTVAKRARVNQPRRRKTKGESAAKPATDSVALPSPVPALTTPVSTIPLPSSGTPAVTPIRRHAAQILLLIAAFGLAGVGVTMNGWFAQSLGSSDVAGWLFLAVGVAADLVALAVPSVATRLWQTRHRATAVAGWAIWAMTFAFAVIAGIGFASTNITDVKLARASRVTPTIETARAELTDAMTARDRECSHGVGPICRQREETVNGRRQALDTAMRSIEQTADPQTDSASRVVAWLSRGVLQPTSEDFAMLRLVLLALLPQIGGILLMVGRSDGHVPGRLIPTPAS
jgi:hypothetical protein